LATFLGRGRFGLALGLLICVFEAVADAKVGEQAQATEDQASSDNEKGDDNQDENQKMNGPHSCILRLVSRIAFGFGKGWEF